MGAGLIARDGQDALMFARHFHPDGKLPSLLESAAAQQKLNLPGASPVPAAASLPAGRHCAVCSAAATKKCGRGCGTYYCCRRHQLSDWDNGHKQKCKVLVELQAAQSPKVNIDQEPRLST